MTEVVGIKFKSGGKMYYFDPAGIQVKKGERVVVETSKGLELGECARGNYMVALFHFSITARTFHTTPPSSIFILFSKKYV